MDQFNQAGSCLGYSSAVPFLNMATQSEVAIVDVSVVSSPQFVVKRPRDVVAMNPCVK